MAFPWRAWAMLKSWLAPLLVAALLLYTADQLFNGERGIVTWRVMREQIQSLNAENAHLKAEIAQLETHIRRLKGVTNPNGQPSDADFLDELLRRDLGLMRKGEVIILVSPTAIAPTT